MQVWQCVRELLRVDLHIGDDRARAKLLPLLVRERERLAIHHLPDGRARAQPEAEATPKVLAQDDGLEAVRGEHAHGEEDGCGVRVAARVGLVDVRHDRVQEQRVGKSARRVEQLECARDPKVDAVRAVPAAQEGATFGEGFDKAAQGLRAGRGKEREGEGG